MKKVILYSIAAIFAATTFIALPSCQKGSNDPVISLKTRKDRFTNNWTLTKYEKNGASQDLNGTTYSYTVRDNGSLTQTVEGAIFGFPVRTSTEGTWTFINDEEDVKISLGSETIIYNLQRMATKELWLKKTSGSDTYTYYFDGL